MLYMLELSGPYWLLYPRPNAVEQKITYCLIMISMREMKSVLFNNCSNFSKKRIVLI